MARKLRVSAGKETITEQTKESIDELVRVANILFDPENKDPLVFRDRIISNFHELTEDLDEFTEEHAPWLADWIEHLGDELTAYEIRQRPHKFKKIIKKRYDRLKHLRQKNGD